MERTIGKCNVALETAVEVEASDDLEDFDREFKRVTREKEHG